GRARRGRRDQPGAGVVSRAAEVNGGLTLLHTNDMHDSRQALDWLRACPERSECLLVDVGDSLRGSNTVWHWDEPIVRDMNELGYAVQAMGNREFHYLRTVLRHRARQRRFPLLACNVEDLRG